MTAMRFRHVAIVLCWCCLGLAAYLHNLVSLALVPLGLLVYVLALACEKRGE